MKYRIEDLDLNFDVTVKCDTENLYIWRTGEMYLPRKKMFCYTFDLDYDSELTTADIKKIRECFGPYFVENDVDKLKGRAVYAKVIRVNLFLAITNSPKCPYKIIGVSERLINSEVLTTYHFMIKHDILANLKTIVI